MPFSTRPREIGGFTVAHCIFVQALPMLVTILVTVLSGISLITGESPVYHLTGMKLEVLSYYAAISDTIALCLIKLVCCYDVWWKKLMCAWLFMEFVFFLRWRYLVQYIEENIQPWTLQPPLTHERCYELMRRAHDYAHISDGGMKEWLSLWFNKCKFEEIYAKNFEDWVYWAFFVSEKSNHIIKDDEIKLFTNEARRCIEEESHTKFRQGRNPNVDFAANTRGKVPCVWHPFLFYLLIAVCQFGWNLLFCYVLGWKYTHIHGLKVWFKLSRTNPNTNTNSNTNQKADISKPRPLLFIHGLGVGLLAYIGLALQLMFTNSRSKQKYHFFMIEIPWTTLSMSNFLPNSYITNKIPASVPTFIRVLHKIESCLDSPHLEADLIHRVWTKFKSQSKKAVTHGCDEQRMNSNQTITHQWTLCGHSYGTFIVSAMHRYLKEDTNSCDGKSAHKIPRLILLDPVALCLSHPITVGAVCFRQKTLRARILQQVVMREIMIALTLHRYMHWYEYVIYPLDLIGDGKQSCAGNHHVFISECDLIVPTKLIASSIRQTNQSVKYEKNLIRLDMLKGVGHANWLVWPGCIRRVVQAIYS